MSSTLVPLTLFPTTPPKQTPEQALQEFQRIEKYARWNPIEGRRETWEETVTRTVNFLRELSKNVFSEAVYARIWSAIYNHEVMPSMRLLAMAGPAARRDNASLYNCSYMPVKDTRAFVEALLISMAGCGVGFSVERQYVQELPMVIPQRIYPRTIVTVEDSAEGWGDALQMALDHWFNGFDVLFDWSKVRPAGSRLETKGGLASGPEPFARSLDQIRRIILEAGGRKLRPLEAHDIMCHIGSAAVSGGVRRTAMISLFDSDDQEMRQAKSGEFWNDNPQRQNANNSAVYGSLSVDKPTVQQLMEEMNANGTGEPGIFNRAVAENRMPDRRKRLTEGCDLGTNPCGEIILRPFQFCNLTAVVARADDTEESLRRKVEIATIIGTIQSTATYFPYLRDEWRKNCEEERLLGVDITGWMDCPAVRDSAVLELLRSAALRTNRDCASLLAINPAAAITCNKPSGNTSVLVNCSSGIHPRWAPYYVRRVRVDAHNAVASVLMDCGVPMVPELGQGMVVDDEGNESIDINAVRTWVAEFPVASPDAALCQRDVSALSQLENWKLAKLNWTEHNPSCTITYSEDELPAIVEWMQENWSLIGGLTFYPKYDGVLVLSPYEEISKEEYERRVADFPIIDWNRLSLYEVGDTTTASSTMACESDRCILATG